MKRKQKPKLDELRSCMQIELEIPVNMVVNVPKVTDCIIEFCKKMNHHGLVATVSNPSANIDDVLRAFSQRVLNQ